MKGRGISSTRRLPKNFGSRFDVKLAVENVLNAPTVFTHGNGDILDENTTQRYTTGATFSLHRNLYILNEAHRHASFIGTKLFRNVPREYHMASTGCSAARTEDS